MAYALPPHANLAAAHGGVWSDLPLLPHQMFSHQFTATYRNHPTTFQQEATRHRVHQPDEIETVDPADLPTPDGGADEEEGEYESAMSDGDYTDDDMFATPQIDDGLPKDLVAIFLKTAPCDKAAAADHGGDREVCAVCLDDLHQEDRTVGVLRCRHGFHGDCIGEWLQWKNVCPLCRAIALEIF